ncbi:TonB-dependent receptor plug domain-containing protein [bacterium]|nr:TonB-dependent receptor plug domain-containing protein [bacterium]
MARPKHLQFVSLIALGLAAPTLGQTAAAQTAQTAQAENDRPSATIIVTANKREESVQDIAVAVTAINSELRDEIGLTTVQDYTNFAPGLSYSSSNDRLGLRGVTRTSNNFGIRSGISNYVDGVYFSSAIPASREPLFTDRVEVVRGPQGTLYGRDSIGGALNVLTKRPDDEFGGEVRAIVTNFDSTELQGTFTGPINDSINFRIDASQSKIDKGYLDNASGLESEGGRTDGYFIQGQLEGQWGDRFSWWGRYARLQWHRLGLPGARTGVGNRNNYDTIFYNGTADIAPNALFGLTDPNRIQLGTQNTNPAITNRREFNTDFTNFAHLQPTQEIALEAIYEADGFDIKYLGGYVYYHYNLQQDHDGTPIKRFTRTNNLGFNQVVDVERTSDYNENRAWLSNELNFVSNGDGAFQWIFGLYQYQENYTQTVFVNQLTPPSGPVYDIGALQTWLTNAGPFFGSPAPAGLPVLPSASGRNSSSGATVPGASLVFHTNNQAVNNAYGVFFQGDYEINDQLKFNAGIRWSSDILDGREYARIVNHYVIQDAFQGLFALNYLTNPAYAGLRSALGANAQSTILNTLNAVVPVRVDVTSVLGGVDPATGTAGRGVLNVTSANPLGIYLDPLTGNRYRDLHAEFSEVTGVIGLDWTPDADTLIYGKYNRGYKPGGLGAADVFGVLAPTPFTDKELVDAFELGFKRDWRDLNLITNAVLFFYNYDGYQVSNAIIPEDPDGPAGPIPQPNPYTAYVNLPKTETSGFELETIWRATDNLRFIFNYGYVNPEIKDSGTPLVHALDPGARDVGAQPEGAAVGSTAANGFVQQGQSLAGNILPFSPKNKIALNATYTYDFESGAKLVPSISYLWQDIAFSSIFNRSYTKIPAWDQVDARLAWTSADENLTIIGFVRNLLDEVQYDSAGAGLRQGTLRNVGPQFCDTTAATTSLPNGARVGQSCLTYSETLRPPQTYGVEVQFRF